MPSFLTSSLKGSLVYFTSAWRSKRTVVYFDYRAKRSENSGFDLQLWCLLSESNPAVKKSLQKRQQTTLLKQPAVKSVIPFQTVAVLFKSVKGRQLLWKESTLLTRRRIDFSLSFSVASAQRQKNYWRRTIFLLPQHPATPIPDIHTYCRWVHKFSVLLQYIPVVLFLNFIILFYFIWNGLEDFSCVFFFNVDPSMI